MAAVAGSGSYGSPVASSASGGAGALVATGGESGGSSSLVGERPLPDLSPLDYPCYRVSFTMDADRLPDASTIVLVGTKSLIPTCFSSELHFATLAAPWALAVVT